MLRSWRAGKVAAEYVWIGGSGQDLRSKTKTLSKVRAQPARGGLSGCCRQSRRLLQAVSQLHVWQGIPSRVVLSDRGTAVGPVGLCVSGCAYTSQSKAYGAPNSCLQGRGRVGSGAPAGAKLVVPADGGVTSEVYSRSMHRPGNSSLSICALQLTHACLLRPQTRHMQCLYRHAGPPVWLQLPKSPEDLPVWNYDGSSTGQAPGDDSEVYLVPR